MKSHERPIQFGQYASYLYHKTPRRILYTLSYYQFAARMIGANKRVFDIGCNEGFGTQLIAKECGYCKGIDFDEQAIETACRNFSDPSVEFACEDFLHSEPGNYDAVINFDVIEHIYPEHASAFFSKIADNLHESGVAIIGTPSLISQEFASAVSKRGHVNIYSHERFEKELKEHFAFVFIFSANDEMVHTGYLPLAHYFIGLACKPRVRSLDS